MTRSLSGAPPKPLSNSPQGERESSDKPLSGFPKKGNWGGAFCGQHRSPIPTFPKGKERHSNALKHSK